MAAITLQVLDGIERGQTFSNLATPITIGREEDNHLRLNDERVSRFHAKIQEDNNRVILTDLESTNGTRVNGHPIQMRVLRYGDLIQIGRCLLRYGTSEQIALAEKELQDRAKELGIELDSPSDRTYALPSGHEEDDLFPGGAPELPNDLTAGATAQVSDILAFAHAQILRIFHSAVEREMVADGSVTERFITVPRSQWHRLQNLEMTLSEYLRELADPTP